MNKILAPGVLCLLLFGCSGNGNYTRPIVKTIREAVYASGFVVSKDEYQVFSQVDGYLVDILVKEGEMVKKGQPVFIIESQQQNARYRIARESYEMAEKNSREGSPVVMEAKAAVERAKSKLSFDSVNFVRYTNLLKSNATKQSEYDQARLMYENSKSDLVLQQSRLNKLRDQLSLELKNASNNLKITSEESGRYTVNSDVDGKVYKTLKEKGELVRRSEAIATIGSSQSFYLKLNIDELDISKIQTGQNVLAKIDAFGEKIFKARVTKVYPIVNTQEQSLRVDADFIDTLPQGFSGLAVEANILIQEKVNAIVIPKAYLHPGDSVIIKTKDGKKKVKVTVGIETLEDVEIASGLTSDSQLYLK